MASTTVDAELDVTEVLRGLRRPRSVLGRRREGELTTRQRHVLAELEHLFFAEGFADLTMADLASRLGCSFRTLYAVAPSRDELVLVVVDRMLWRVGQSARDAIEPAADALDAIRRYLMAAHVAVSEWTEPFARDLSRVEAAAAVADGHREYLFQVTRTLLEVAVRRGETHAVDTAAVARVLAGLDRLFVDADVIPTLTSTPKHAADAVLEIVLRGLRKRPR